MLSPNVLSQRLTKTIQQPNMFKEAWRSTRKKKEKKSRGTPKYASKIPFYKNGVRAKFNIVSKPWFWSYQSKKCCRKHSSFALKKHYFHYMCKNVKSRKPIFAKSKRAKAAPHKDNTTPEHVQGSMAADSKKKKSRRTPSYSSKTPFYKNGVCAKFNIVSTPWFWSHQGKKCCRKHSSFALKKHYFHYMCKNVKSRNPIFAKSKRATSAPHKDNTTPEHVQGSMAAD